MDDIDNETIERLLLLANLLEFNSREDTVAYMERFLKLSEPDFQDVLTIKGFQYTGEKIEVGEVKGKKVPGYVFEYDARNADMSRLEEKKVCWKDPLYLPPSDETDLQNRMSENDGFFHKTKLKIESVDPHKRQFVIFRNKKSMEEGLAFLNGVEALTEFEEFKKPDFQRSIERIINSYLDKLGFEGEADYLQARKQFLIDARSRKKGEDNPPTPDEIEEIAQDVHDNNKLAFSIIEKSSVIKPTDGSIGELVKRVKSLDNSYLAIQGPPGTGKTYTGAKIIHSLLTSNPDEKIRIGITAQSYSAIDNLLAKVISFFSRDELELLQPWRNETKRSAAIETYALGEGCDFLIENDERGNCNLVASTAWNFVKKRKETEKYDYLFIDEAGQFALYDAIACCASARNIILLGDPMQLPQVTQATHELGAGQSVLEYLIGNENVVDHESGKGVLLDTTYRLRPEICDYTSAEFYEGKLSTDDRCLKREISNGRNGLFWIDAKHKEESVNHSLEEAQIVKQVIRGLINQPLYRYSSENESQVEDKLQEDDFMIVTPYNAQIHLISQTISHEFPHIPIGTVDKFQGKEAPVIIYSMATTSRELVPPGRGDFIYKPNRLNVAVTRAQCLSIIVANRELVEAHASSIHEMRDMNHLCRIFEDEEIAKEWAL